MDTRTPSSKEQQDKFSEIRPYRDHEFRPVLEQLLEDPEFIDSMAAFLTPRLARWIP